jgi:hypothetical protein
VETISVSFEGSEDFVDAIGGVGSDKYIIGYGGRSGVDGKGEFLYWDLKFGSCKWVGSLFLLWR